MPTDPPSPTFPLGPFRPAAANPVLRPSGSGWQSANVYNPAAIVLGDRVVLLYRAHAEDRVSHIGLAVSSDGLSFDAEPDPVLTPEHDYERQGCEDPRIARIDGTFYLTYTGYDGTTAQLCLATSTDLRNWTKHGSLFPEFNTWATLPVGPDRPWSKAGVICPEPIGGRYRMFFGEGAIHAASSDDLLHWTIDNDGVPVHRPTPGRFDATLVEVGAPPVVTRDGLLILLTNAATGTSAADARYQCAQLAVAASDTSRVLAETVTPWLTPQSFEETNGLVANVTFVEGLVWFGRRWIAYYGQSDTTVGAAVFDPAVDDFRRPPGRSLQVVEVPS